MGRFAEHILYGTPVYPEVTTPDGRIVSEQYRARIEARTQHGDVMGALRSLHAGREIVPRSEFDRAGTLQVMQGAARSLWDIQAGQQAMIRATEGAMYASATSGFEVARQIGDLRSDLRGLEVGIDSGLRRVGEFLSEALDQGDAMMDLQRERNVQGGRTNKLLENIGIGQEDIVGSIGGVSDSLDELIDVQLRMHEDLIDLKKISIWILSLLEEAFEELISSVRKGAEKLSFEIAMSRMKIVRSVRGVDSTIRQQVGGVALRLDEANALLGRASQHLQRPRATGARELIAQGFKILRSPIKTTEWSYAVRIFDDAIVLDPTIPESYYGLGLSYQVSGNHSLAEEAYSKAIGFAGEESPSLVVAVSLQRERMKKVGKGVKNEVTFLRDAIRGTHSDEPEELLLIRALILCDLPGEAEKIFVDFMPEHMEYFPLVKDELEMSRSFYTKLHQKLSREKNRLAQVELFKVLIQNGEVDIAVEIFNELLKVRPSFILQYDLIGLGRFGNLKDKVKSAVIVVATTLKASSAETFYTYSVIAFRLDVSYREIAVIFTRALSADPAAYRRNAEEVQAAIRKIDPHNGDAFIHYITSGDANLAWLSLN